MSNQVAITSDVDWAPEPVLGYMLNKLQEKKIKCTFFCTHYSEVLLNADPGLFELAIHPNFNPLLQGNGGTAEEVIVNLMQIYPQAKGVRSHSMLQSTVLLNLFAKCGLQYESNQFLPYQKNIQPHKLWNGLVRLSYFWEDDMHWMYGNSFEDLKIDWNEAGLKIFDFHPVHIYLNTVNETHYLSSKENYQLPEMLWDQRNKAVNIPGAEDALMKVIREIEEREMETVLLRELATQTLNQLQPQHVPVK